ncbi:hypothetical protein SSP24_42290 [Streptomyces spinoverrucosus]|uniref:Uncharacterized protein n=1 Tax=Streptomyces spinoverrucosus TaxID=284043 RepID=A0A4Y3VI18_9ACTN|nr:hypothetical protein [Streptomyces spinoverrucosus]GEC06574.1 hypothetical protein SSP24_42290 [Streptomyces spinoverrucosus]GHB54223.1 hypothetical protein GCM10010397_25550 [Streptomyces spinoverrucosus]
MTVDLVDWRSTAASDFSYPEAVPASRLADELSALLIREGHFDAVLEVLGDSAIVGSPIRRFTLELSHR